MELPDSLTAELVKMRRNPANFISREPSKCKLCRKGKSAYPLLNAKSESGIRIGLWCSVHGWLFFDSVGYPPTERLRPSEVEDARLHQRRQSEHRRRKAEKAGFEAFCQQESEL